MDDRKARVISQAQVHEYDVRDFGERFGQALGQIVCDANLVRRTRERAVNQLSRAGVLGHHQDVQCGAIILRPGCQWGSTLAGPGSVEQSGLASDLGQQRFSQFRQLDAAYAEQFQAARGTRDQFDLAFWNIGHPGE